ncbi:MAG: sugar hydrolase [Bacteroidetes bacterium GWC2_33_15]|nr:MAG: sugar hydrolase [Bacteroidetes bacterium GWA2_33_15]OFX51327.1 MAG: sugar hydrolase [Bacteroidetes bacterium GWC2_33_15]OFX65106.1 MAG: sugar hydrolase [Bacteroidetes bacterium GWB2_32_14]OFX70703.1 MAG: sugar hydrolase [Bacteroidetes bacterium GWD2_33_33]HAN18502.1 sugar hydrolase [Bacteroidales bacterium]
MRTYLAMLFCVLSIHVVAQTKPQNFIQYVNPFVGTKNMGHTFPGATVPFGMVQLSPETDTVQYEFNGKYNSTVYRYCSGYQYDDKTIVGFSHTHFSGTGHSDLGDFLIMPTVGKLQLNPGTSENPESGYRSRFSHTNEIAEPAYYKVHLDDYNITTELTATTRTGFHQYTFPQSDTSHIILDMISGIYNYNEKNVWTFVRVENDTLITGYRQTNGWARTRTLYFAMVFSKPFYQYGHKKYDQNIYKGFWRKFDESQNFPEMAGKNIRAYFDFKTTEGEKIKIKFALSPVSTEGALKNLAAEIPHWDFDKTKSESQEQWNDELGKIVIETNTLKEKETFYTALYHTFLSPVVYMDVNGAYRGLDQNNHFANGFTNYTIFSLWDTYRALHPLYNIIQPKRNSDMVTSMLEHYNQSVHKMLPVWSHYANENWCMIGYHSVPVIVDAFIKGNIKNTDPQALLRACVNTAENNYYDGLNFYMQLEYVPEDKNSSSVSKTLEYAYDDWCIAQMAKHLGNQKVYDKFITRSQNFIHVYDSSTGFMRPKLSDGTWKPDFNTLSTHGQGFIEGNAWNYSLYVPHQPGQLIQMMGGKEKFTQHLDSLFSMQIDDKHFAETEDITRDGIIGNYIHGNEPGHHIPYLYNWTGQPWKTQERVRMIMETMYSNTPDGLCGNDDAGQMSAWYIFSALGFYPVCPGSDQYAIGSPMVKSAVINLENGKQLVIETKNQKPGNVYVNKVVINGNQLKNNLLLHSDLIKGCHIVFYLESKPRD